MVRFLMLLIGMGLFFTSCYERKEGCLDTYASDYDPSADDVCTECCHYPRLQLAITHLVGDSVYSNSDTLVNQYGQRYIITDVRYYVSDFHLYQADQTYNVRELIGNESNKFYRPNDIKIIRSVDKSIDIGSIRAFGTFDSLRFTQGISRAFLDNTFTDLPTNHVLSQTGRLKDADDNIAYMTVKYRMLDPIDSLVSIAITEPILHPFALKDSINTTRKSENIRCKIKVDYQVLFDDIDFSMTNASITQKMRENAVRLIREN
ncbi:MAG: hypothetical protein J5I52_04645 [Saprospiraceae bacterium]|nr:MAG: hypothetical protein UZ09_BCD002000662 [Bacteroidetes bacterium OLB9]MCO6463419.1 hypothetical protein [Saprospiraceae bacterium]MCZ2338648.1 hypothetical protein [Chitinophagales bacterium]